MVCLGQRYEIVFLPTPWEGIVPLRETADPNVATIAFNAEMERLREDGATGELVLINYQSRRKLMLRQPLRPSGAPPPARRAPLHPGVMNDARRLEPHGAIVHAHARVLLHLRSCAVIYQRA